MFPYLSKKTVALPVLFAAVIVSLTLGTEARGQETRMTPLPAPPPIRVVSRDERSQLAAARDAKARMRLSVELAEARLVRAEQMTSAQQFESAARELGTYTAIIADIVRYLREQREQKKLRDVYKRLEITLRAHGIRMETMRRTTPSEHAFNIKTIIEDTKDLRAEALNGFYGDDVLRDDPEDNENKTVDDKTTGSSQSPPKDQP